MQVFGHVVAFGCLSAGFHSQTRINRRLLFVIKVIPFPPACAAGTLASGGDIGHGGHRLRNVGQRGATCGGFPPYRKLSGTRIRGGGGTRRLRRRSPPPSRQVRPRRAQMGPPLALLPPVPTGGPRAWRRHRGDAARRIIRNRSGWMAGQPGFANAVSWLCRDFCMMLTHQVFRFMF
jgi:hypothetical protein